MADYLQKLQNGEFPNINARDVSPYKEVETVAMQAALLGDSAIFNLILKQNPDLNATDPSYHRPPITWAIHGGTLILLTYY